VREVGAAESSRADPSVARPTRASARAWWSKLDGSALDIAHVADPAIDELSEEGRATLAAIWQERGGSELRVSAGFAAVAAQLIEHGAADSVLKLVARAVRDEVHHAEISVEIAARYRGSDVSWPPAQPVHVPVLAPAEGKLRATLLVVAMCCINETLACAILERQLSQAKALLTRAALQTILSDEIEHARAGWAHLASVHVTAPIKAEIGRWLPRLLNARLRDLLDEDSPFPGEQFPEHGILTRKARKEVVASTLDEVVFPGFSRAGVDPSKAKIWADGAFRATAF
jgi:hypothetical protein